MPNLWNIIFVFIAIISYAKSDSSYPTFSKEFKFIEKNLPKNGRKRPLLPKLLPLKDENYLVEFNTYSSEQNEATRDIVKRVESELGIKFRRINVQRKKDFLTLLDAIGFNDYGGFPFYFNRRTAQAVGGQTSFKNLLDLATGNFNTNFQAPPESLEDIGSIQPDQNMGVEGIFSDRINSSDKNKKSKGNDKKGGDAIERAKSRRLSKQKT